MYAGHFAIGVALSSRFRDVPPWIPMIGVGWLDIVHGGMIAAGLERIRFSQGANGYLNTVLEFVDWDHSLAMALVWAALAAAVFWRDRHGAWIAAAAVFSHFPADWVMHDPDLALWPHASTHLGMGLWSALPVGSWFLETGFVLLLTLYAARKHPRGWAALKWPLAILLFLSLQLTPWWSPLQIAESFPQATFIAFYGVLLSVAGFILPTLGIAHFLKR